MRAGGAAMCQFAVPQRRMDHRRTSETDSREERNSLIRPRALTPSPLSHFMGEGAAVLPFFGVQQRG